MIKKIEPKEAFPYTKPNKKVLERYSHIFELDNPVPPRLVKNAFDKVFSLIFLILSIPIFTLLKLSYIFEGFLIKENSGPLFFYYWGVSQGKKIKKYKLRIIKEKYIEGGTTNNHDWMSYSKEWDKSARTYTGKLIKKYYLDELPQFYSILKGDMSIVGPRPLSVIHYERDLSQGNVARKFLKGGLLGLGHIRKGTEEFGSPIYEYEYLDMYIKLSALRLLIMDLKIIFKGILLVLKGQGL